MSEQSIVADIEDYIRKNGGRYSDWYVGVASDPKARLFNDHGVSENGDAWIYGDGGSDAIARNVEEYFLKKGSDGDIGGGDRTTHYAYAYKKNGHTKP